MITGTSSLGGELVLPVLNMSTTLLRKVLLWSVLPICLQIAEGKGRLDSLEFNGELNLGNSIRLSFYDPQGAGAFWVQVGEARREFHVLGYDPGNRIATVRHDGKDRRIKLKSPRVISITRPKVMTQSRLDKIHRSQLETIYGNEKLVAARLEVMVAREEKEAARKASSR